MLFLTIIAYLIIGFLAGILGGLLGVGGGVITVPCFYLIFYLLDYPHVYIMQLAIGTSLAAMVFNTLSSTWAHHKRLNVAWNVFRKMAFGLLLGSIIGALITEWLSTLFLEIIFGVFLCLLGIYFWRAPHFKDESTHLPKVPLLFLWSSGIGGISNILGIGGGTLIVPFLTAHNMPAKKAIGTSAACSLLITSLGAISYLILGLKTAQLPEDVGFINIPAFLIVGIVSFLVAPYGAKLTDRFSVTYLRKIFSIVLLVTGLSMIL
jgi:uncharacterized membrane protein YfcA